MEIKVGSWWIEDTTGFEVLVKSIISESFSDTLVNYDVFLSSGERKCRDSCSYQEFLYCKTPKLIGTEEAYERGFEDGSNSNEVGMYILRSEQEHRLREDSRKEGFKEGYNQAYGELHSSVSERERDLQKKAWNDGYNQACKEFAEEGDEFWDDEESSEEVGEEYCFIKDLQKLLGDEYKHPENPMSTERKHSHYFKDVRHLDYVDIYQICKLFPVDDDSGAIVHARKKLLVAGGRGAGKDMIKDITEARDTLSRYLQIEGYE